VLPTDYFDQFRVLISKKIPKILSVKKKKKRNAHPTLPTVRKMEYLLGMPTKSDDLLWSDRIHRRA
jgi:hypothetical protein